MTEEGDLAAKVCRLAGQIHEIVERAEHLDFETLEELRGVAEELLSTIAELRKLKEERWAKAISS